MSPHTKHVLAFAIQGLVGLIVLALLLWAIVTQVRESESDYQARRLRERREEAETARRLQRQRRLLAQAEFIESVPEDIRQRLQREAEALSDYEDDAA